VTSGGILWDRTSEILGSVRLERFGSDIKVPLSYAGFTTESLLRTHLLPYLVPLKSERALAFELGERPELQIAVGLTQNKVPTRATLWHFRRRNSGYFRCLLLRSLAVMAIEGSKTDIALPFLRPLEETRFERTVRDDTFQDLGTHSQIIIHARTVTRRRSKVSPLLPFPDFRKFLSLDRKERTLLHEELHFPIPIEWRSGSELKRLCLVQPPWLNSPYEAQDLGNYFGKGAKTPYTACNVLVLRKVNGYDEVLLCRRLLGSGVGEYALPGGKKFPQESIIGCVKRELQEEVGIEFRGGRPISLRKTRQPGFPAVVSIGVVATEWHGLPRRREHLAHSNWDWYKLTNLPTPLFFPTKWAIEDYLSNSFPHLDWSTIEPDQPLPLWER
jgi:ADP-ribose pyrophosphatase YjhB (NUDIX family)